MAFPQRQENAGTKGLNELNPYDAKAHPPEYKNHSIKDALLTIVDKIVTEYADSLKSVPVGDPTIKNPKLALSAETVFANEFDPLGGR